jgi:hypothetical protein
MEELKSKHDNLNRQGKNSIIIFNYPRHEAEYW